MDWNALVGAFGIVVTVVLSVMGSTRYLRGRIVALEKDVTHIQGQRELLSEVYMKRSEIQGELQALRIAMARVEIKEEC